MDKDTENMLVILGCISIPIVIFISAIWGGIILSTVWNWFMPQIFGLMQLNVVQAIAVMTIVGYLTKADVSNLAKEERSPWANFINALLKAFLTPLFFLAIAFIIKQFM